MAGVLAASSEQAQALPRFQPRPPSPKACQPSFVTATVSSSLMKPRVRWFIVVSIEMTMPLLDRTVGVVAWILLRSLVAEPRRLMGDDAHAVCREIDDGGAVRRGLPDFLGDGVNLVAGAARLDRLARRLLDLVDRSKQVPPFRVGLAEDAHSAKVADIAFVVAA
jgi:hypothetical protein